MRRQIVRRVTVAVAAILIAVLVASVPVTLARFTAGRDTDGSFTTGSILPPTSLGASVSGAVVTLTWTPTTSTAATGYELLRSATSGSGYAVIATVTPRTASTTTNSPGSGTWYYILRSVLENWRSASSNEATATVAPASIATGFKRCTTNAADTGGDNNGYQTSPGNGCAVDGAVAIDANSGTNTTLACANTGKDRHRFGTYELGLPGTVTSVNGIELRLVAGMSNGGTTVICAQLSWDGGTTWTATKQVTLTANGLTTYTLGGTVDTWGRSWTAGNLADGAFVVRLIDVSNRSNKNFNLDGVSVQVTYTP